MADITFPQANLTHVPIVFVLSDADGTTATNVVEAAADQFEEGSVIIKKLRGVSSVEMVCEYLDKNIEDQVPCAVFHTIVQEHLRREIRRALDERGIASIDLLGPAINILANLTLKEPICVVGRRSHTPVEEIA